MKSGINLVILTPGFAADEQDSSVIPSIQLYLNNLRTLYPQINIHIISLHYPAPARHYHWNGIPVYAAGGSGSKAAKIFLWARVLRYLNKLRKNQGIDLIHAFWLSDTALVGSFFGRMRGIPVVATAMGQDIRKQNRYLGMIKIFRPELVTISEFQANNLPRNFSRKKPPVIPFGTDPAYFGKENPVRNLDILGVGGLNKIKNYPEFVEIIRSLAGTFPGLKCAIIGEGNERGEIEQLIRKFKLEGHIALLGQLPYEEVIRIMHECKILLHTSVFEGQGLVITEALAAGAFVVCHLVGTAWGMADNKIMTGQSKEELEERVRSILISADSEHSPRIIVKIAETCAKYYEIYSKLSPGLT